MNLSASMKKLISSMVLLLGVVGAGYATTSGPASQAQARVLLDDLLGEQKGALHGGQLTSEGYRPGIREGRTTSSSSCRRFPNRATSSIRIKGMEAHEGPERDIAFSGMYDGRGVEEPAQYFRDFKDNYFRWNSHWRTNRQVVKNVISMAAPSDERTQSSRAVFRGGVRDWSAEPNGAPVQWDKDRWHTVRLIWNGGRVSMRVDDVLVWEASGPYPYAPVEPRLWIGCAPGYGTKYTSQFDSLLYRHLKVVALE